jgi:hypothetical protein
MKRNRLLKKDAKRRKIVKFDKGVLQELAYEDYDASYEVVERELVDTSRWSHIYSMVFTFEGKFYRTQYSVGATEQQDESPYEYGPDSIECEEVEPIEVIVVQYRKKTII